MLLAFMIVRIGLSPHRSVRHKYGEMNMAQPLVHRLCFPQIVSRLVVQHILPIQISEARSCLQLQGFQALVVYA